MSARSWFALIVVASLAGVAIWATLPDRASPGERERPARPSDERVVVDPDSETRSDDGSRRMTAPERLQADPGDAQTNAEPTSRLAIMREVEAAESAVERVEALKRLREIDPVVAETKLLELATGCSEEHLSAQERIEPDSEHVARLREWCTGLELSAETIESRLAELTALDEDLEGDAARIERMARNPYLGRQFDMEQALADSSEERRTDRFTELVREARDWDDLFTLMTLNAGHANQNEGRPIWQLGLEVQNKHYPQAELLEAQKVALMMFGCYRFGGCQTDQFLTLLTCTNQMFGRCGPSPSLMEQLYLTTRPVNYDLARVILASL